MIQSVYATAGYLSIVFFGRLIVSNFLRAERRQPGRADVHQQRYMEDSE